MQGILGKLDLSVDSFIEIDSKSSILSTLRKKLHKLLEEKGEKEKK